MKKMPIPVVQRLTKYLVYVQDICKEDIVWVSSNEIAQALSLTSSTVRQDLSHLEISGISKRGYETAILQRVLCRELGADKTVNAVIVGAGNLGRALALHGEFGRRGFGICAIFDSNTDLIGEKIEGIEISSMEKLKEIVKKRKIDIGMIAVPASAAQSVADLLVSAGVKGLLNLTLSHVCPAGNAVVVDTRIIANLQELLYLMRAKDSIGSGVSARKT
ncbi:redox-sensing transcriptional repressor Rex [Verrucomicrobiota bacterium]